MRKAFDTAPATALAGTKTADWSVNRRITGHDVVQAARGYLGVRYELGGRSRDALDCVGLLVLVAHDLGSDWECETPSLNVNWETIDSILHESGLQKLSATDCQLGDLVVFRTPLGGPNTVKIVSGTGGMASFFGVAKFINFVEPTFLTETVISVFHTFGIKREFKMNVQDYVKRFWRFYRFPFVGGNYDVSPNKT